MDEITIQIMEILDGYFMSLVPTQGMILVWPLICVLTLIWYVWWWDDIKKLNNTTLFLKLGVLSTSSVYPVFLLSIVVWYWSSQNCVFTLVIFRFITVMVKSISSNSVVQIVWYCVDIKYHVMYITQSGSHSFLPWVAIYQKEMFFFYYGQPTIMLYLTFSCLNKLMFSHFMTKWFMFCNYMLFIINWIHDFKNSPTPYLYVFVLQCKIDCWTFTWNYPCDVRTTQC